MLLPPPHTPLHPPVPLPPLCIARGCGVWWRADVCVPLCVSCEQRGDTPLHRACFKGHRDVALRLVHHGANPLIKDNNVRPPLCGGRVSGRVLRGTEDLGTEFRRLLVQNHFSNFVTTILDTIKESYSSLQNVFMSFC